MFRRRKRDEADVGDDATADQDPPEVTPPVQDVDLPAPPGRPQGPWDVADLPTDDVARIDLGGLLVPVPPETEVRVEVDAAGEVVAATLVRGEGSMQLNAFAAPRTAGIWLEVLEEIAGSLRESGGSAETVPGPYGAELHAGVPTQVEGQGVLLAPARFLGVDGPRWFLRALLSGAAAVDEEVAAPLVEALRDVVVVRGTQPMAVRDPLPLRLPRDVAAPDQEDAGDGDARDGDAGDGHAGDGDAGRQRLQMPERGPEITETR